MHGPFSKWHLPSSLTEYGKRGGQTPNQYKLSVLKASFAESMNSSQIMLIFHCGIDIRFILNINYLHIAK